MAVPCANPDRRRDGPRTRPDRLTAIDTLKGVSMIMIFYCHFAWVWRADTWIAFSRLQWMVLDFFGPTMFVAMSIVGSMASYQKEVASGGKPRHTRRSLVRISYLFAVGEVMNAVSVGFLGIWHVFAWNVITTIAIFSLLMPYIARLNVKTRLFLIACVMILYYPLVDLAMASMRAANIDFAIIQPQHLQDPATLCYVLFFHHGMMSPLIPWIMLPLCISIVFDPLVSKYATASAAEIHAELKKIAAIGAIMIAGAIALGLNLSGGFGIGPVNEIYNPTDTFFHWPFPEGVPAFFVRHTPQYMFYTLGIVFVFFSGVCEWQLVRGRRLKWDDKINNFGILSLTGFTMSHAGFLFPWIRLDVIPFFIVFIPILLGFVYSFWLWTNRCRAALSLEWFMGMYTALLNKALERLSRGSPRENPRVASGQRAEPPPAT
ncbi:MAG: hypothetical protein JW839_06085 [Candidatus Lokiarchaeota archaeon]|nr:hypothetical protein [Candidatus Lokiarchaeota archaeon]